MEENLDMLALADRYKELKDKKADMLEAMKALQEELDSAKAKLIESMISAECTGFKRNGFGYSLVIKEYPGAIPEVKDKLYDAMREHGFEHLFTIPTNTLSATLKELKANNDDKLPDFLEGMVGSYEEATIQVRKATK